MEQEENNHKTSSTGKVKDGRDSSSTVRAGQQRGYTLGWRKEELWYM